jgi:hypothetical protein
LAVVCDHAATSGQGGVVGQEQLPAEDMAALGEAVLGFYEESIGRLVAQRRPRSWPPPGRAGTRGRGGLARSAAGCWSAWRPIAAR